MRKAVLLHLKESPEPQGSVSGVHEKKHSTCQGHWTSQAKPTRPVTCSLGSMGPCRVTLAPCFHGALQCHTGGVILDPWCHEAQMCHTGLLFPWGSKVSQWSLGSMRPCSVTGSPWCHRITMDPWFHGDSQCQKGLLGSMRPCRAP